MVEQPESMRYSNSQLRSEQLSCFEILLELRIFTATKTERSVQNRRTRQIKANRVDAVHQVWFP